MSASGQFARNLPEPSGITAQKSFGFAWQLQRPFGHPGIWNTHTHTLLVAK